MRLFRLSVSDDFESNFSFRPKGQITGIYSDDQQELYKVNGSYIPLRSPFLSLCLPAVPVSSRQLFIGPSSQ